MKQSLLLLGSLALLGASPPLVVTMSPARPTVGDIITITFPADARQVVVRPSVDYEVLDQSETRVTLRSFKPGPFTMRGTVRRQPAEAEKTTPAAPRDFALNLTIASVLQPGDSLQPADLKPPRPLPPNATARLAIAAAALLAILSWVAVFLLVRRPPAGVTQTLRPAREEFRTALAHAQGIREAEPRLIALAEATRVYLARTDPRLRREITTFELLRAVAPGDAASTVRELLTAADLAKFSPWGAGAGDSGNLIERLRRLPDAFEAREEAA